MEKELKIRDSIYHQIDSKDIFSILPIYLDKTFHVDCSTLHWTAGNYDQVFSDYQILIKKDGSVLVAVNDFDEWREHEHTWHRNSYNVGIAFCCMFNKNKFPVTDEMIEAGAKAWSVIKKIYGLSWKVFKDHTYYSDLDEYEPKHAKWDCRTVYLENGKLITLYEKVLKKAQWYYMRYLQEK